MTILEAAKEEGYWAKVLKYCWWRFGRGRLYHILVAVRTV